jgi:hypothetical protein
MTEHLSWDTLNDLVDERLDTLARRVATTHIESCAECRSALGALHDATRAARELPPSIDPPQEVWASIRESIEHGKAATLRGGAAPAWWATPRRLAAAAVVLVLASSGLTAIVMQRNGTTAVVTAGTPAPPDLLPVAWQAAERGYLASVGELYTLLEEQRGALAPSTIASVERTLATIDMAIAEARMALLADPANAALVDLLASNYRHKVELLRRATQLEPRS